MPKELYEKIRDKIPDYVGVYIQQGRWLENIKKAKKPEKIYREIKKTIEENNNVLFIGTPCQCQAARNACDGNESLYTVELICCPFIWRYLQSMQLSQQF